MKKIFFVVALAVIVLAACASTVMEKGDYVRAIADYTQAIRLDPNYAEAYFGRGNAYKMKGDYDRAIADFTEAIRINPNYAEAYSYRGNAYYKKKDYDRAIEDYKTALQINPDYYYARVNLIQAYQQRGY